MKTLYTYRLKTIMRDRANMFWTLVFPILLGTLFFFSFGQLLDNIEHFEPVDVAVVTESENSYFDTMLEELSGGEQPFIHIHYADSEQAMSLLENEDVSGIYIVSDNISLTVREEGVNQSMLRSILDTYLQTEATVTRVAQQDPTRIEQAAAQLAEKRQVLEQVALSGGSLDFMRENFYALIAMTCLYGSFFGLSGAVSAQPNLSALGARRSVTPTSKLKLVWSDILAAVTVMFGIVVILLLYLNFVLGVDLGGNVPAMLLASLCGVFVGVMFGLLIGVAVRGPSGAKDGILIGITLLLCFFSGLMYSNMRFIVEKSAPIVNKINPAALIVDSFYTLDAYGVGERYWTNIILLVLIGAVFCIASVTILRRKQYASI
jgi:ABC-2 type transport system permease protein